MKTLLYFRQKEIVHEEIIKIIHGVGSKKAEISNDVRFQIIT